MRILIVEDEDKLADALKRGLEKKGFAVDWLSDSEKARTRIMLYRKEYDLIILDLMMPGIDGATICKEAREHGVTTPIIILTARTETENKVDLLNIGADDYMVKPFSFDELIARIHSVLRRPKTSLPGTLKVGAIEMDTATRTVKKDDKPIPLTLKEFSLLECFMRRPNEVISREELFDHAWDFEFDSFSNVLEVHMKNLRKKLSQDHETVFETVRGVGYRLVA
jgi:DNA-binding response OmpR family regulator